MIELLSPAGDMEKLKTAIYFGADAVYVAGKNFGLRAFAGNFDFAELKGNNTKFKKTTKGHTFSTQKTFA